MTSKIQKKDTAFLSDFLPDNLTAEERARCAQALGETQVAIGRGLDWAAHFAALDWPRDTALICDNNTWKAAAEHISQSLADAGYRVTLLNLGSSPKPTAELAEYIVSHTASSAALIAVGSGTLNDLTKHAAFLSGKPYAVCGTAASMNGYLSANAAILAHGHKKSLPSRLPRTALFDLDVLEAAPRRLQAAGLGDSICRSTAQVDWLISHHLIGT
ncbi:MAG: sn-glycerol-1-phosphate dehydrogenase, partial [Alphaproteobacteria bacterium]|nr:sn-glycerol-1-phosphate dehydrogenase [Alphaproteobacteria bacterium]